MSRPLVPVLAVLLGLLVLYVSPSAVEAAELNVDSLTIDNSITIGGGIAGVKLSNVKIANGASVVIDVPAMIPGETIIRLEDCECDGGSQIYVLGYKNAIPPAEKQLSAYVSNFHAASCSLVFAYRMPDASVFEIANSTLIANTLIAFPAIPEMGSSGEVIAPPLAFYDVTLPGNSKFEVTMSTLASTMSGGMGVYLGGATMLVDSLVYFDRCQVMAPTGSSAQSMYISSLSLRSGSLFSVSEAMLVSGGRGVVLGSGLQVSESVLRLVKVRAFTALTVFEASGSITAGAWVALHGVVSGRKAADVADLSKLSVTGGRISLLRNIAVGSLLGQGPRSTDTLMDVQCNKARGVLLSSVSDYATAGMTVATVVSCDACSETISCYGPLTSGFDNCECTCSAGGFNLGCGPKDAPHPPVVPSALPGCTQNFNPTQSLVLGRGSSSLCYSNSKFSGAITADVDLTQMDGFAEYTSVTFTDCTMLGGAMLRFLGTTDAPELLVPVVLRITNMIATDGTIVFRDAFPRGSRIVVENSTLGSTTGFSQYRPSSGAEMTSRHGPSIAFVGLRLDESSLVVTRTVMTCSGTQLAPCSVMIVEAGLVLTESSMYLDNSELYCPNYCLHSMGSPWTIERASVLSFQNSTWVGPQTISAMTCSALYVTTGSAITFVDNDFRVPYALLAVGGNLNIMNASWLVFSRNRMVTYYGIYSTFKLLLSSSSVFSAFDNSIFFGSYSTVTSHVMYIGYSTSGGTPDETSSMLGGCNRHQGDVVMPSSYLQLGLGAITEPLACGACSLAGACFGSKTASITDCTCSCSSGGYGDACLPSPIPTDLGPLPPSEEGDVTSVEVECVYNSILSSVTVPGAAKGMCFVDCIFSAAVALDLSQLNMVSKMYNVTLLRCTFKAMLTIYASSSIRTYVNMTEVKFTAGQLTLSKTFAENSELYLVDSLFASSSGKAIEFLYNFGLGLGAKMLILRTTFRPSSLFATALYFSSTLTLTRASFIVEGCTFEFSANSGMTYPAVQTSGLKLLSHSTLAITNNVATLAVILYLGGATLSDGVLLVSGNTQTGTVDSSAVVHNFATLQVSAPSEFRVENNVLSGATLFYWPTPTHLLSLEAGGPVFTVTGNTMTDTTNAPVNIPDVAFAVDSDELAAIIVGCNTHNDEPVEYENFPEITTVIACGACNQKAACYGPGTSEFSSTGCTCQCNDGIGFGPKCLPYLVPVIPVLPEVTIEPSPPDRSTTCVRSTTITDSKDLSMWKTDFCYENVTFSGTYAAPTFDFSVMPTHLPIFITLIDCTFTNGAALVLSGTPMNEATIVSEGISVNVTGLSIQDGCVALYQAMPTRTSILLADFTGVQTKGINVMMGTSVISNMLAAVLFSGVKLNHTSLVMSGIQVLAAPASSMSSITLIYMMSSGIVTNHSLWVVRYCNNPGYSSMAYISVPLEISDGSAMVFNNNTVSGESIGLNLYLSLLVSGASVFRFHGNVGDKATAGLSSYGSMNVKESSWFDFSGNDFPSATLLQYMGAFYSRSLDATSVATIVENQGNSLLPSGFTAFTKEETSTVVAGCLVLDGVEVNTAAALTDAGADQTRVAECGECTKSLRCFQPLTTGISGCTCQCTADGYGSSCLPVSVPDKPLRPPPMSTPPPPPPPPSSAPGECISDFTFPQINAAYGAGTAWLCFRNVVFSGVETTVTIDVASMDSEVVNIRFENCHWSDKALLDIIGAPNPVITALNILVLDSTYVDAGVSVRYEFPQNTNITFSGTTFQINSPTRHNGIQYTVPYSIASYPGLILVQSALVITGCKFTGTYNSGYVLFFNTEGLQLRSQSLFASLGNSISRLKATFVYIAGRYGLPAVALSDQSVMTFRGNSAPDTTANSMCQSSGEIRLSSASMIVLEENSLLASSILLAYSYINLFDGSYVRVVGNAMVSTDSTAAVVSTQYGFRGNNSHVIIMDNSATIISQNPVTNGGMFKITSTRELEFPGGVVLLKCNMLNEGPSTYPANIADQGAIERDCEATCKAEEMCAPKNMESFDEGSCKCECTSEAYGDVCAPLVIPPTPDVGVACVTDVVISAPVSSSLGSTKICFKHVNFTADVTVMISAMSNNPLEVTFVDCQFTNGASLYLVGSIKSNNAIQAIVQEVWFRDGSGLVISGSFGLGSQVTVVDSHFLSTVVPLLDRAYNGAPATCVLFHNVTLSDGSALTVARTEVTANFEGAVAMSFYAGLKVTGRSSVVLDSVAVETLLTVGILVDGGEVILSDNSLWAVLRGTFLLCEQAIHISAAVEVAKNSGLQVSQVTFARLSGYAMLVDGPSMEFSSGSQLLVKECTSDATKGFFSVTSDLLPTVTGSTWSFASITASTRSFVTAGLVTSSSEIRMACNTAGGEELATANDYRAAGLADTSVLKISACGVCDRNTYCYGTGTTSASLVEGGCRCTCTSGTAAEACFAPGPVELPPAADGPADAEFILRETIITGILVIPHTVRRISFESVKIMGSQVRIYVPWMADGAVSIDISSLSISNGGALYILGGGGVPSETQSLQLHMCSLTVINGAVVFAGSFPVDSAIVVTDSNFLELSASSLPYLGTPVGSYAPAIVLSSVVLKRSVLIIHKTSIISVVNGGRAMVADGSSGALSLDQSGLTMDAMVIGANTALHVFTPVTLTNASLWRLGGTQLYGGRGIVFAQGMKAAESVVFVTRCEASLATGPLMTVIGLVGTTSYPMLFPGSWLNLRDVISTGGQTVLLLPSGLNGLNADGGTLSIFNVSGDGARIMEGSVVVGGVDVDFIAGCVQHRDVILQDFQYASVGVGAQTGNIFGCGVCNDRLNCFAPLTDQMRESTCQCYCKDGGYGANCLPVYAPAPDGCSPLPPPPPPLQPSPTPTTEEPEPSPTPVETPTMTVEPGPTTDPTPRPTTPPLPEDSSESVPEEKTETPTQPVDPKDSSSGSSPNDGPCPAIGLIVVGTPAGTLRMTDIRDTNEGTLELVAQLPQGYQWTTSAALADKIHITRVSGSQPSGYDGPWGDLLRKNTWVRTTAGTARLALPRDKNYFITTDEELLVTFLPDALRGGCSGAPMATVVIKASTAPALRNALYGVNTAVATVTAAVVLFTGGLGSILEIQTLGVFAKMSCATAYEQETAVALPYFLSFFAHHGPLWMMVGNACIAIAFGLLHYAVVLVVRHVRKLSLEDAFATVLFPSLTYLVAYLMHLGIFVSSAFMLALPSPKGQHYALGVVGVLYGVAFPFGVYYVLTRHAAVNFVKYWQFSKKPFYVRWLYPIGYWNPPARQRMYGSAITNMKGRYMLWCVFPLVVLCVVGIIAAVRPPANRCHIPYFCMAAVLLAAAVVVAVTNMMRSGFLTAAQTASFVLLAVLCVINGAIHVSPSQAGLNAYSAFELLLMVLLMVSAVYSFAIGFAEIWYWRTLREPKKGNLETLLNDEGYDAAVAEDHSDVEEEVSEAGALSPLALMQEVVERDADIHGDAMADWDRGDRADGSFLGDLVDPPPANGNDDVNERSKDNNVDDLVSSLL